MRWKLTTLIENHVDKEERYMCEHGLAILIESENQEEQVCLLMDTGKSGIFYENAAKMGISLENLGALLISHAHYDHAGGVKRLIEEETIRKIYVGKDFFQGKYYEKNDGTMKDIGIAFSKEELEKKGITVCEVKEDIDKTVINTIYSEITDTIRKETADVTYRMLFAATGNSEYLYHLNEEQADNIKIEAAYFLDKNDGESNNTDKSGNIIRNYIVVEASADISDNEGSEKVYFMFVYNNAYVTINGTFNIAHDNPQKRFACAINEEKLYDEYVGDLKNNYTIDKIK